MTAVVAVVTAVVAVVVTVAVVARRALDLAGDPRDPSTARPDAVASPSPSPLARGPPDPRRCPIGRRRESAHRCDSRRCPAPTQPFDPSHPSNPPVTRRQADPR